VELLIDRVIVTAEEVEIRYVIPTDPSSEHVRFCHLRSDYLHNPPARQEYEALLGPGVFDHLKPDAVGLGRDLLSRIAPVHVGQLHALARGFLPRLGQGLHLCPSS